LEGRHSKGLDITLSSGKIASIFDCHVKRSDSLPLGSKRTSSLEDSATTLIYTTLMMYQYIILKKEEEEEDFMRKVVSG
jgi:hypothetical protein